MYSNYYFIATHVYECILIVWYFVFVTTYLYDRFWLWQLMFIIDYVCYSIFIFMIIYKYFMITFILYILQFISYMCGKFCALTFYFFCDNLCIIYSNLLWDLILAISLHRTQRNRVRTKKIKKI